MALTPPTQACYVEKVSLRRDVALVLSGGGMNGVLMELGFLKRIRESEYWPRVGWIFGTSAGALAGTLAAVDRLDELERFLLALRAEETFRPHRLCSSRCWGCTTTRSRARSRSASEIGRSWRASSRQRRSSSW